MIKELDELSETGTKADSRALVNLELEEIHTIFELTKVTPQNEQPSDEWKLAPRAPWPELLEFYGSLSEFPILPSSIPRYLFMVLAKALSYTDAAFARPDNREAQIRARLDRILYLVLGFAEMEDQLLAKNMVSWGP